jgi:amidase
VTLAVVFVCLHVFCGIAGIINWFGRFDALICPVNAKASYASSVEEIDVKNFSYTFAFNFTGWPGAVVRCGTSDDGMPIGVQVVAKPWREDICLAVAKFLETMLGGWQRPSI